MLSTLDPYTEFEGEQLARTSDYIHIHIYIYIYRYTSVNTHVYGICILFIYLQTHSPTPCAVFGLAGDMRESVSGRYGGVGLVIAGSRVASPEAAVSDALVSRGTLGRRLGI